jgi:hypothetical protein
MCLITKSYLSTSRSNDALPLGMQEPLVEFINT